MKKKLIISLIFSSIFLFPFVAKSDVCLSNIDDPVFGYRFHFASSVYKANIPDLGQGTSKKTLYAKGMHIDVYKISMGSWVYGTTLYPEKDNVTYQIWTSFYTVYTKQIDGINGCLRMSHH